MTTSQLIEDIATANAILFREGVFDTFGHVSARVSEGAGSYLIGRSIPAPLVKPEDIVELDLDSKPVKKDAPGSYSERFIHGEIYRVRPDVGAVIHAHSPAVLPFTMVKSFPLRPACHTAGFLGDGAPVFDMRSVPNGSKDLLVTNNAHGAALAQTLGKAQTVLMRGHGFTIVGRTLKECVYNAIYAVNNARVVLDASRLGGEPIYLSDEEAAATTGVHGFGADRPWQVWKARVEGRLP